MASSSRPCTIEGCKSPSRTVCICCEKCYCLEHLTQHFGRINNKIPPLSDKINGLAKRLNKFASIEPSYLIALEKWRDEAHRTVEQYYESKRRDLIDDRREKLEKEVERVRHIMEKLIRKHDAVQQDVDLLTQDIRLIEQKFSEFQSLRFTIHPLVIDDNLIIRDLFPLPTPCRTMKLPFDEFPALANNEKNLLVHQPPNISLLDRHFSIIKQTPWTHDNIWDMCWSSTLSRFIIVTNQEVFTLDQNTMTIAKCPISSDVELSRATCSDSALFLLAQGLGPSIFEYKLPPSSKNVKERSSPETCEQCEYIFDLKANQKTLAMVIFNTENDKTRLDLKSSINLQRLWSVDVGQGFRCCLLHGEQWMVVDALNRRLYHISNNGKLLKMDKFAYQPWNIIQWGKFIIGIRTNEAINLY
ncbi:unnamed protein product [Rotaria sp. Silwood2]|nr:unnamed protein product [Rotaria sp. Silwood2]CAF2550333.1 unnamed protein product [Rotaria sp. Silwood2]CAF2738234.1 unnamed protein product [Rotaria sp. Silwood2]CAF2958395.1 unnamed protein product [Rotaria sp. Silwood2]CAF4227258.1 unnamed protein product [Rotaria sp. Silwood2]